MRKRPRTIRLLRQAAAAAILQLDLEHPATLDFLRSLATQTANLEVGGFWDCLSPLLLGSAPQRGSN